LNTSVARVAERLGDRLRGFAQPWEVACFFWVPAIAVGYAWLWEIRSSSKLEDFGIFRIAAKAVLDGHSPYPAAEPHALAHFDKFVYPPSTALLFTPLAVIPLPVAEAIMLVLGTVCVFFALRLLDVRDWRCYGVAVMSAPAVNSLALGAVTSFLLLGTAATWHYRNRPAFAGLAGALTAVSKLFLWPLGLWLLATRRLRATLICATAGVVLALAGWSAIGFAGLGAYPHLLNVLSQVEQGTSYSVVALLGLSGGAAGLLSLALVALVALSVLVAGRGPDGDRRGLAVAVVGALIATPVLWAHYFLLLFVPIALYRPRLSGLWLVPLVLWLTPATHSHGELWRIALALAVTGVVLARTVAERQTQWPLDHAAAFRPLAVRRIKSIAG
jgi:alpha-1,2-mannosyltransferase